MPKLFSGSRPNIEPMASSGTRRARQPSDKRKIEILGKAIADAAKARHAVSVLDGVQAGFSEAEVKRFWDDAMVEARAIFPGMAELAVQP